MLDIQETAEKFLATEDGQQRIVDALVAQNNNLKTLADQKQGAYESSLAAAAAAKEAKDQAAAAAVNAAKGIEGVTGNKNNLLTNSKTTLVDAINEVKNEVTELSQGSRANAWGVVINPNSANSALDVVGNYALWTEFKERIGRYLVSNDGSKAIKLDTMDSSKYVDGQTIDETKGHIMVHVPDLFYHVETASNGNVILWMSGNSIGGHAIHTSGEGHGSWIGAYLGRSVGGKLVSRSGGQPTASQTISSLFSLAQQNGQEFGLSDYQHRQLMMMLYLSEFHNENSQAQLGVGMNGNTDNWSHASMAHTGATAVLGDNCGKVDYTDNNSVAGANHVSLFGIEDPYGWYWEMIQGCYFGNSDNAEQNGTEMFLYKGNRIPSSEELTTRPAGDYRQLSRPTSSGSVYRLQMGDRFDVLPGALGGGGWDDYHYANATGQLLLWGGAAYNGSNCGLAFSRSDCAFSDAGSRFAARLAFYGNPTIVTRESEL